MRNLEDIEKDLAAAREALSCVEGTPAEVYSRIVGYYRSVRNWNRGKREEYGERRLYCVRNDELRAAAPSPSLSGDKPIPAEQTGKTIPITVQPIQGGGDKEHLLLFVRASCPGCAPAKTAAARLGIPVTLISADTAEGMAEAVSRNVLATPTAILLSPEGRELTRAWNAETIERMLEITEPVAV